MIKFYAFNLIISIISLTLFSGCSKPEFQPPYQLTVNENFTNPIGFYDQSPAFSWWLPANETVKSQTAYRIVVASAPELLPDQADLWDSKQVNSNQSLYIPYQGRALKSRESVLAGKILGPGSAIFSLE